MYIYICIYVYVNVYVYIYIYLYIYICTYTYVHVYTYTYIRTTVYMHTSIHPYIHVYREHEARVNPDCEWRVDIAANHRALTDCHLEDKFLKSQLSSYFTRYIE